MIGKYSVDRGRLWQTALRFYNERTIACVRKEVCHGQAIPNRSSQHPATVRETDTPRWLASGRIVASTRILAMVAGMIGHNGARRRRLREALLS